MKRNFKIIRGGELPKEKRSRKFISAYLTDTRLMGALSMYIHWKVPNGSQEEDLHQFFYFDVETFGFETYYSVWGNNISEIQTIEHNVVNCLGGNKVIISQEEASSLLKSYISFNEKHGLELPEGEVEYYYEINEDNPLSLEESKRLFLKQCSNITSQYQLINLFLMRYFAHDIEGLNLLSTSSSTFSKPKIKFSSTVCKNTIKEADNFYVCETLVENESEYNIFLSHIHLEDLNVKSFEIISKLPISPSETAMILSRPEYITVFDIMEDHAKEGLESFELKFASAPSVHENGKLFLTFNENNDYVNKKTFRLSDDVFGIYYISDFGQIIVASYNEDDIENLEQEILGSSIGDLLFYNAKYEFTKPLFYEFVQSDFEKFEDFLETTSLE